MSTHKNDASREAYSDARRAFDELKIEDKAIFMVESAFAMVIQGIEKLGAALSTQFADEADASDAAPAPASDAGKGTAGSAGGTKKTTASAKGKTTRSRTSRSTGTRKPKSDPST